MNRRESITWYGTGAVLLLFAVTGLIGALVKSDGVQGLWRVDVTTAATPAESAPLTHSDPGNRWLVVKAKVENTGKVSQSGVASLLRLSGVDGLITAEPAAVLVRDNARIDRLNPGLPEEVAFVWEQSGKSSEPKQVTVQISGKGPVTVTVGAP